MVAMRHLFGFVLLFTLVVAACAGAGCGSDSSNGNGPGTNDGGPSDGPILFGGDAPTNNQLVVLPANPTLNVAAPGVTQQFQAMLAGQAVPAQWSIDVAGIGSIDGKGLFTASGQLGGPVQVSATAGGLTAFTTLTIHLAIADNPGNVDPPTQGQLQGGGNADGAFRWLYPYDATVFPRDVPSPLLQFGATGNFDAAYVHITYANLDYKGFYGASPGQIRIAPAIWAAIAGSTTSADVVKVDVTKIAGGKVSGPITESWRIAPGNLRGSIYYNSYNSVIAGTTGAVLKLRPGQAQPTVAIPQTAMECHVCHVVSANGNMLVAANEPNNGGTTTPTDGVWDLTQNAKKLYDAPNRTWDFGALYPDGSRFLRYGAVPWSNPGAPWVPDVRGLGNASTDLPSLLFDPKTGAQIPAPGLDGKNLNMMMPAFSPDGKHVAFTHYDTGQGHTIAVMDFDAGTNTFSNLRDVASIPSAYVGWPTFTPDSEYVFFAAGTNNEYDTMLDDPSAPGQPTSNIVIAHVPSATIANADGMNGVSAGKSTLPFPDDPNLNFEPTILPVASGGHYWVVFTTRRNYGSTVNGSPYVGPGGAPSPRKKLWVAAIDIDPKELPAASAKDITHPAFYLDGQELGPGNMRAFWALDPCEQNGTSCQTGVDCCSGFCRQTAGPDGGVSFSCVPQPSGCAQEGEKCNTAADCCGVGQGYQCTNGFCSQPTPK
jgi:hypothetical protein